MSPCQPFPPSPPVASSRPLGLSWPCLWAFTGCGGSTDGSPAAEASDEQPVAEHEDEWAIEGEAVDDEDGGTEGNQEEPSAAVPGEPLEFGPPVDIFAEVADHLDALEFETLEDAARAVAAMRASDEPEARIVLATEPLGSDAIGGFVIIDVLDLGDDSVKGERLRIEVGLSAREQVVQLVQVDGVSAQDLGPGL